MSFYSCNMLSVAHSHHLVSVNASARPSAQMPCFFSVPSAKKRRPHPADSAFEVHGKGHNINTHFYRNVYILPSSYCSINTCRFRTPTWLVCWVQGLLGTWRTWVWPSPMSPVPVQSSLSSCPHSNSSTCGPRRYALKRTKPLMRCHSGVIVR